MGTVLLNSQEDIIIEAQQGGGQSARGRRLSACDAPAPETAR